MQSKFDYIPPNLVSEGLDFQVERVVKLAKAARSDLSQVSGGHLNIEEQIIRCEKKYHIKSFISIQFNNFGHISLLDFSRLQILRGER